MHPRETNDLLETAARLQARFAPRLAALAEARNARQQAFDDGELPVWHAPDDGDDELPAVPGDLLDRRVELTAVPGELGDTGGASVILIELPPLPPDDTEAQLDAHATIAAPHGGPTRMLRPRTLTDILSLDPEGGSLSAAVLDTVLYLGHGGRCLCLPGIETAEEAVLWADLLDAAANDIDAAGDFRVTVLVDNVTGAFALDPILVTLRPWLAGAVCGRQEYLASFIACFRQHAEFLLPDYAELPMAAHFLRSWGRHVIKTAHRHGTYAIGPLADRPYGDLDDDARARSRSRLRADKEREVRDGFDGTRVPAADLTATAREAYERFLPGHEQIGRKRDDVEVAPADLLHTPHGKITAAGMRENIGLALDRLAGTPDSRRAGAAARARLAAAQLWQWVRHPTGILDEGRIIDEAFFRERLEEETQRRRTADSAAALDEAAARLLDGTLAEAPPK